MKTLDRGEQRAELEGGLESLRGRLEAEERRQAHAMGLVVGLKSLPPAALVLVLAYFAVGSIGPPPFTPLLLPLLLLPVPLAAILARRRRLGPAAAMQAALLADHQLQSKDRISAALEFCRTGQPGRFEAAAIEEGQDYLHHANLASVEPRLPRPRPPLTPLLLALAIAFLPSFLALGGEGEQAAQDLPSQASSPPKPQAPEKEPAKQEEQPPPPGLRLGLPLPLQAATHKPLVESREASEVQARPRPERRAAPTQGAGLGNPPGARARLRQVKGEPRAAGSLAAGAGSRGRGGQGQATRSHSRGQEPKSRQESEPSQARKKHGAKGLTHSPKPRESESSATPGGPSRTGGQLAAVGNRRSLLERGQGQEEEVEQEAEDLEDQKEESQQRGGVMPLGRDRRNSPSRELGISGDGPPRDGRGGPTPPKKSRGTAALVLGIRLQDQVRGQPNPGTAKTRLGQVPPKLGARVEARAEPAAHASPPTVQSREPLGGALAPMIRRYHEFLHRAQALRRETRKDPSRN